MRVSRNSLSPCEVEQAPYQAYPGIGESRGNIKEGGREEEVVCFSSGCIDSLSSELARHLFALQWHRFPTVLCIALLLYNSDCAACFSSGCIDSLSSELARHSFALQWHRFPTVVCIAWLSYNADATGALQELYRSYASQRP